jgi:hypothetical protein
MNQCATGYHFASFAELSDLSNLTYDSALGRTADDAGDGPPSFTLGTGWIRTGYKSNAQINIGTGEPTNCNLWTSAGASDLGTVAIPVAFGGATATGTTLFTNNVQCNVGQSANIGVFCVHD